MVDQVTIGIADKSEFDMTRSYQILFLIGLFSVQCGSESVEGDTDTINFDGAFDDGVYHCCAPGEDTACCDGYDQGMCYKYGGTYGACVGAGETISGKVICALCCDGLTEVSDLVVAEDPAVAYPNGCTWGEGTVDLLLCLPCGNGVCDHKENRCNCPEDCNDTDSFVLDSMKLPTKDSV